MLQSKGLNHLLENSGKNERFSRCSYTNSTVALGNHIHYPFKRIDGQLLSRSRLLRVKLSQQTAGTKVQYSSLALVISLLINLPLLLFEKIPTTIELATSLILIDPYFENINNLSSINLNLII